MNGGPTWIVTVAEPLFYGAMYRRVIAARPQAVAGVVVLPDAAGGGARRLLAEALYRLRFWGPRAFLRAGMRLVRARLTGSGDVARAARRAGIPVHRVETLREAVALLEGAGARRALASVPVRVRPAALAALPGGWVNVHCGPLPRYGGIDAPFWCLYHGEAELAVTLHYMAEEFDAGPIIDQQRVASGGRSYFAIVDELFATAAEMLVRFLDAGPSPDQARPQDRSQASYFGKPPAAAGREFRRRGGRFV